MVTAVVLLVNIHWISLFLWGIRGYNDITKYGMSIDVIMVWRYQRCNHKHSLWKEAGNITHRHRSQALVSGKKKYTQILIFFLPETSTCGIGPWLLSPLWNVAHKAIYRKSQYTLNFTVFLRNKRVQWHSQIRNVVRCYNGLKIPKV
jgi:hypothetical protein